MQALLLSRRVFGTGTLRAAPCNLLDSCPAILLLWGLRLNLGFWGFSSVAYHSRTESVVQRSNATCVSVSAGTTLLFKS